MNIFIFLVEFDVNPSFFVIPLVPGWISVACSVRNCTRDCAFRVAQDSICNGCIDLLVAACLYLFAHQQCLLHTPTAILAAYLGVVQYTFFAGVRLDIIQLLEEYTALILSESIGYRHEITIIYNIFVFLVRNFVYVEIVNKFALNYLILIYFLFVWIVFEHDFDVIQRQFYVSELVSTNIDVNVE